MERMDFWPLFPLDFSPRDTILMSGPKEEENSEGGIATVTRKKVKRPRAYKVLLHNDDYTTMDFVVYILRKYFRKTEEEAQAIMLKVHHEGVGVCGIYTREVAETKVAEVMRAAKKHGHPLLCTYGPE